MSVPYQTLSERRASQKVTDPLLRAERAAAAAVKRQEEMLATARSRQWTARLAIYEAVGGTEAARLLGISREALYKSIRQAP